MTTTKSRRLRTLIAMLSLLALFATACGSTQDAASTGTRSPDSGDTTNDGDPSDTGTTDETDSSNSGSAGSSGSGGSGGISATGLGFAHRLEPFTQCDAYLAHIKAEAIERVGPWGLNGDQYFPMMLDDVAMEDMAMEAEASVDDSGGVAIAAPAADSFDAVTDTAGDAAGSIAETTAQAASDGDETFSGTNVQVDGVDEPDIVKTDGRRIIALQGQVLDVFDVTGDQPTLLTSIELPTWAQDILLNGDTVLVMASDWGWAEVEPFSATTDSEAGFASDVFEPEFGAGPITTITQIDIAGTATVTSTMRTEGQFVSARMIGDIVRIVVSSPPPDIGFVFPQSKNTEDIAKETNQRIIEESTLEDWLPQYSATDLASNVTTAGPLLECTNMHRPTTFAGFSTLSVMTVDINGPLSLATTTGILADGSTVYASNNSLYVTTTNWQGDLAASGVEIDDFNDSFSTSVHRFDITDPSVARYVASGVVPGSLLSQFSLHEWDNRIFVATTEGVMWNRDNQSESFITVLEPQGENLVEVGRVGNMGLGEQIFSVRFIESNAYVVTFRQVDPLYVVDLSSPTDPFVAGELKVPGFSTYLHPVGDKLLLGVGQDATDTGRTLGAKLSLFDVSNPSQPTELSTWVMPNSDSGAQWDHRAFLWWAPRELAILPVTSWQENFGGAVAVTVNRETGITEIGRLDNTPPPTDAAGPQTECKVYRSEWGDEIQVCGPDQEPIGDGLYCEPAYWLEEYPEDLGGLSQEFGLSEDIVIPEGHTVSMCWPDGPGFESIRRSIVIGDDIWTLSNQSLQRNSLDTFAPEARIELTDGQGYW